MKSLLLSWATVGSVLAAGAAGYVGVTAAQIADLASTDDVSVSAYADPPPPPAATAPPAAPAAPAVPDEPAATPSVVQPAEPAPVARPAAAPSRDGARLPAAAHAARRPAPRAPARRSAAPALTPQQEREVKHAIWADRQLARMLRSTPHVAQWFGGAAWVTPVAAYHLTARFGETSSLWASIHTGLDFAAPTGTPVRAATAGTVTFVGWAGAYGNKIEITHPGGTETWYAHLSRTNVHVGSQVGTGAVIGAVGATGNVTGPHLHFEVRPGGDDPVDPEDVLREHGVRP